MMGRIKTKNIKQFVRKIVEDHRGILHETFEENKPLLKGILKNNITKRLLNRINGYIVRRLKIQSREHSF